jgi:hypothetical protein
MDMSKTIEELAPSEVVDVLVAFFECAAKRDGGLYPPGTLYNLLSALNGVLRHAQELRIMHTGVDKPPFNMKLSPMFRRVVLACVLAMQQSCAAGVGVARRQVHLHHCCCFYVISCQKYG